MTCCFLNLVRRFQSTLPYGSDLMSTTAGAVVPIFQSTLPYESDPNVFSTSGGDLKISIHAPSRERLCCSIFSFSAAVISIHAPSRERQHEPEERRPVRKHFNPRSLAGATYAGRILLMFLLISIHAPSRERLKSLIARLRRTLFQSTLPRGSD